MVGTGGVLGLGRMDQVTFEGWGSEVGEAVNLPKLVGVFSRFQGAAHPVLTGVDPLGVFRRRDGRQGTSWMPCGDLGVSVRCDRGGLRW